VSGSVEAARRCIRAPTGASHGRTDWQDRAGDRRVTRGIGRGIARRLAADGALEAVHYGSNEPAAKETVAAIQDTGGQAFAVRAELGVPGDVDTLFAGLEQGLAGRGLDILVNNAGGGSMGTGLGGTVEQVTGQQFDRVLALNANGTTFGNYLAGR
jgi:3-oxoacyl-[acyl-carrier protein] reductase